MSRAGLAFHAFWWSMAPKKPGSHLVKVAFTGAQIRLLLKILDRLLLYPPWHTYSDAIVQGMHPKKINSLKRMQQMIKEIL